MLASWPGGAGGRGWVRRMSRRKHKLHGLPSLPSSLPSSLPPSLLLTCCCCCTRFWRRQIMWNSWGRVASGEAGSRVST